MKILIALGIIFLLSNAKAEGLQDELNAAEDACIKDNKLNPDEVFGKQDYNKPTESLKIFAGCLLGKMGFVKNGIIQKEVFLEKTKFNKHTKFFKHCARLCSHITGSDHNDVAYKLGMCFKKVDGEIFLNDWNYTGMECKDELQLSDEDFAKLQKLPLDNPTLEMKRYANCILTKQSFLKNNQLQENVILEVAEDYEDADFLKKFINQCKQIKETDQNDMAFELYVCLLKIIHN